jgi:predicted thioesterase
MKTFHVGQVKEDIQEVTRDRSATHIGSGTLGVYATPAMVLFIEMVCKRMTDEFLSEGEVTVGVRISLDHLAPTPVGDQVRIRAEIVSIEGNLIDFKVELWDAEEKVGEGEHRRAIINIARFMRRVESKAARISDPAGA